MIPGPALLERGVQRPGDEVPEHTQDKRPAMARFPTYKERKQTDSGVERPGCILIWEFGHQPPDGPRFRVPRWIW